VVGRNWDHSSVSDCYNTGDATSTGDYSNVGGVVGINSSDCVIANCYYNKDRCTASDAVGYGSGTNVKGLTTAEMTGTDALTNLSGFSSEIWLVKADGADSADGEYYWYYPHLKGFNFNDDLTQMPADEIEAADWPAKTQVSVTWEEPELYDYSGSKIKPVVTSVIIGDSSAPEGATVTYSQYYGSAWSTESEITPTDPGNYRMTIRNSADEIVETKYFTILQPDTDYTAFYYKKTGMDSVDPIDAGDYKAVVTFLKSVVNDEEVSYLPDDGHAPIEKEFTITPKSLTSEMIADIADVTYNGRAQTPAVTVKDGSNTLTKGTDYTVSYSDNVNVARDANGNVIAGANAIVTGKGNYTGIVEKPFKITPKAVTITANSDQKAYDGSALTRSGFTASALEEGDTHEFTVAMTAGSTITDFGTKENVIATVDGVSVTPDTPTLVDNYLVTTVNGTLTVTKAKATVTITGHYNSAPYDGKEHSVSGYDVSISNPLYTDSDFTFSGTAEANRTDSGTASMGLKSDQFANNNPNFEVIFNVTDGYQTIVPLNVEV
ncbi:MAG: hypothetical protein IK085_08770, partial [Clostridia bacterium]|nr:hypothetical protein [Clostridia bacterium]